MLADEAMVEVGPVMELSLNSVVGLTTPRMFKVKGTMEDQKIVIMIDCGATHNFISLKLVDELKLPMAETTNCGSLWVHEKQFKEEECVKISRWGCRF